MSEAQFVDYYALLGIAPNSEVGAIRSAFIQLAKIAHPDVGGSAEHMRALTKAYKTLTNTEAKAAYDMLHNFHVGGNEPVEYKYHESRQVQGITDLNDDEIDSFLNSLWAELREAKLQPKPTMKQRVKKFFEI